MNVCNYFDRLEVERGKLVRVVMANARKIKDSHKKLDVYKEYENGKSVCRNLYTSLMGYRVGFPNEVNSYYTNGSCSFIQKLEKWGECRRMEHFPSRTLVQSEREKIAEKYPAFKYVLDKWSGTIVETMAALGIWKKHKDIEFLLAGGFSKIALNKSFWKMTIAKRKEVALFLRKSEVGNKPLADVLTIIKQKCQLEEFNEYKSFCWRVKKIGWEEWKYLMKIGKADTQGFSLYADYKNLLKQTEHDRKDLYWKFPKDLQKKHDELLAEVERVKALKNLEKLREKQERYTKVVKKLLKNDYKIDGYRVYIPSTVDEIQEQASALHQCLIQCDYVSKVINRSCVLVFVSKNGKPVATVELLKGNKIGQFYADELDRNNCLPSKKVREVMNKWVERKGKIRWSA